MLKLSIIIPVYNVEKYLRRCLDSVIYPDLEGYEIIVVNDGSTDSSPIIAGEYAAKYPSLIRLITTGNGGLGHARNTGIDAAKGEFLVFLDSDDRLAGQAVPEMLKTAETDFDICVFDFITVNEQDRQLKYTAGSARTGAFSLDEYPELLFQPPNAWLRIWRSGLFSDTGIRFPDRMWFEDLCTTPKLYLHAKKIIAVQKPWYIYLLRSGSITNSKNPGRNTEMIAVVDSVLDYYKRQEQYEKYYLQLEYMAVYHELITSTTRVNLIDRKSGIQDELLENFTKNFPNFRQNPYVRQMGAKLRLLTFLITHRMRLALNLTMRLNNLVKKKINNKTEA